MLVSDDCADIGIVSSVPKSVPGLSLTTLESMNLHE